MFLKWRLIVLWLNKINMNNSKMLYHYCTLEKAVELILPKYQLLVNDISKTKDPRENKIFPIEFNYSKTIESLSDDFNINNEIITISDELRKGCKVLCFSVNKINSAMRFHQCGCIMEIIIKAFAWKLIKKNL